MINERILGTVDELRRQFQDAKPFKFLKVDDFFAHDFAEKMLSDFPGFESRNALNEFGKVGGKAVVTKLGDISTFYAQVYEYILSPKFLSAMSTMTGIPDLLPDPRMYGGGTHENVHGQEMDPHVDFNYDQDHGYHRRINLIVYLNKEWDEAWGGAIELHSNPRKPESNEIVAFNCLFNRAVIFETNEYSWHGFKRVQLPEQERNRSRKSLSIYLYTRDRPAEEIVPSHGTFYVPRPLTFEAASATPLTSEQIVELKAAIKHRDIWIEYYQNLELKLSAQLSSQASHIKHLLSQTKAPVSGSAKPHGQSSGLYPDGWVSNSATFSAIAIEPIRGVVLRGWIPDHFSYPINISVRVGDDAKTVTVTRAGQFSVPVDCAGKAAQYDVQVTTDKVFNGAGQGVNDDKRDLAFLLTDVEFLSKRKSRKVVADAPQSGRLRRIARRLGMVRQSS